MSRASGLPLASVANGLRGGKGKKQRVTMAAAQSAKGLVEGMLGDLHDSVKTVMGKRRTVMKRDLLDVLKHECAPAKVLKAAKGAHASTGTRENRSLIAKASARRVFMGRSTSKDLRISADAEAVLSAVAEAYLKVLGYGAAGVAHAGGRQTIKEEDVEVAGELVSGV